MCSASSTGGILEPDYDVTNIWNGVASRSRAGIACRGVPLRMVAVLLHRVARCLVEHRPKNGLCAILSPFDH